MRLRQLLHVLLIAGVGVALMWPASAHAQRRGPGRPPSARPPVAVRAPTYRPYYRPYYRPDYRPYYRAYDHRPYFWYPYSYPYSRIYLGLSFGLGLGYPFAVYGGYGYGYGYPVAFYPGYGYAVADQSTGSVRIQVKPRETEVYVDGYYVGIVDDYDGLYQRLRLPSGEHEIQLYLDGHRVVRQTIYVTPGATLKVQYSMEPLGEGETPDPRPTPPPEPEAPPEGAAPAPPPTPQRPPSAVAVEPGAFGTLAIRVQPADAEVLIDGEPWTAPAGRDRLVVRVAEGTHTVVVRKDGYETFSTEVTVRRGETVPLNVSILLRDVGARARSAS